MHITDELHRGSCEKLSISLRIKNGDIHSGRLVGLPVGISDGVEVAAHRHTPEKDTVNTHIDVSSESMFAQLVQLMGGKIEFQNLVNKYQSDKGAKGLTTWTQFIAMLFCQLTGADSLREISDGLYSSLGKLSHLGATAVCRSTLS